MAVGSSAQLVAAIDGFQAALTPEQKVQFLAHSSKPDATSVITFMTKIDNENATRRQRGVSSRLFGVLESIRGFSDIVDTFVSSHPNIAALVWGSIKFVIHAANNITIFFEKLSKCFLRLGKCCPRYSEYQALFVDSIRLQKSLSGFYATIINFCAGAYQYIQNTGTTFAQALWRPYEKELGDFESTLLKQNDEVEAEIRLASEQAADKERKAAAQYRRNEIISRDKATKHARERRLLKDQHSARVERKKLLDKLSSHDYWSAMRRIRKKRHGQTSSWLSRSKAFTDWLEDANSSTLWLSGILGSGKSTVTAAVIEFLLTCPPKDQNHLCFFFCEYDNLSSLDARIILGTLIRQCLSESDMSDVIETKLKGIFENPFSDVEDLESLLQVIAATPGTLILIIDGFDECRKSDRITTLNTLQRLISSSRSKVKVFLSSREDIIGDIDRAFTTCHHVCMDCEETHADILAYVEDLIDEKMLNGDIEVGDPQLIQDIRRALANGANGMFLWVAFQLDDLCHQKCDADIRKALRTLPRDLTETYGRILTRIIKDRNEQIVGRIFRWVAAAKRPLLLDELQEAIAVKPMDPYLRKDRLVTNINNLISWCSSLVILQEEDSAVQFAHHSVKQFLLSDLYDTVTKPFHLQLSEADHEVGEICVTYLHFNDFERQVSRLSKHNLPFQPKDFAASTFVSSSNRAARYGTKFVRIFSNKARPTTTFDLTEQLSKNLPTSNRDNSKDQLYSGYPLLSYVQQFWLSHTTGFLPENTPMWNSWAGLISMKHDLATKPWMMQCDENIEKVITNHILAEDHLALLHLFLLGGYQFSLSSLSLSRLLVEASGKGNIRIVKRLIDAKIDINHSVGPSSGTAVLAAAENGHIEVLELLLKAKVLMYGRVFDAGEVLRAAAERGHLEVVKWLLSMKLLLEARHKFHVGIEYDRLFCEAAGSGHVEIMELLLKAGFDINVRHPYTHTTPLRMAAKNGNLKIVKSLLAAHAKVDDPNAHSRRTALHEAAESGHGEVVEVLLAANANVNAVDPGWQTPLLLASKNGHVKVTSILLGANADDKIMSSTFCRTPLLTAARQGYIQTVKLLLTAETDVNRSDANGDTALHLAAEQGHLKVVEALLAAKAELNFNNDSRQTAMDQAQKNSHTAVIELLQAAGAKRHRDIYEEAQRAPWNKMEQINAGKKEVEITREFPINQ